MSDLKPWKFEELCKAIRRSIEFAYQMERKNEGKSIPYDGPELTSSRILATSFNIKESFTDDGTEWCGLRHSDERARDALDVIIGKALHLGMEQGWRILGEDQPMVALFRLLECNIGAHMPEGAPKKYSLESIKLLRERMTNPGLVKPSPAVT